MVRKLIRLRVRLWWANERSLATRSERLLVYLFLAGIGALALWTSVLVFATLHRTSPGLGEAMVVLVVGAAGAARVVFALPRFVSRGFLVDDLDVWLTSPVPMWGLYMVKSLEMGADGLISGGVVFATSFGFAQAAGVPGGPLLPAAATAGFFAVTGPVSQLVVLLLMRLVPARLLRIATALMPMVAWLPFLVIGSIPRGGGVGSSPRELASSLGWAPTTWAANLVVGPAGGRPSLALMGIAGCAAVGLATFLPGAYLFRTTFMTTRHMLGVPSGRPRPAAFLDKLASPLKLPTRALAVKDWRMIFRDLKTALNLAAPMMFMVFIIAGGGGSSFPFMFLPILLAALTGGLLHQSWVLEGRDLSVLLSLPLSGREIFIGKLAAGGIPALAIGTVAILVVGLAGGHPIWMLSLLVAAGLWGISFSSLLNLSLATTLGEFGAAATKPSPAAALAGSFGTLAALGIHAGTVAVGALIVRGPMRSVGGGLFFVVLLTAVAASVAGTLWLAGRAVARLDRLVL